MSSVEDGAEVRAPMGGRVVHVGRSDVFNDAVRVKTDAGVYVLLDYLTRPPLVAVGDVVVAGQVIGYTKSG